MSTDTGRGEHSMEPAEGDPQQGEEAEARVRAQQETDQQDSSADEDPEQFAEEAGVDPTPQQVDEYRTRVGDPPPEPEEPPD